MPVTHEWRCTQTQKRIGGTCEWRHESPPLFSLLQRSRHDGDETPFLVVFGTHASHVLPHDPLFSSPRSRGLNERIPSLNDPSYRRDAYRRFRHSRSDANESELVIGADEKLVICSHE